MLPATTFPHLGDSIINNGLELVRVSTGVTGFDVFNCLMKDLQAYGIFDEFGKIALLQLIEINELW